MLNEFRNFILRGNVLDLAVAVIIGAAFNGIVTSLIGDMVTPWASPSSRRSSGMASNMASSSPLSWASS